MLIMDPPSDVIFSPVMELESSDARKTTTPAISSGVPCLCIGIALFRASKSFLLG